MAKKPTGAVSSIPGVLPGMDSSYYQQVASLVSQSFAQTSARQNAHYGALINIVGQTGNTLMAGMQNYMAYSLEKQKMLFKRDLASRQLDLAVQDMDIKRIQADRAYELQTIEKQKAIQQLASAQLERDRINERWKAQAALGEAEGALHNLLGEIGDLAPTQDQERRLSELSARMNMAYTAASSVGGVDEVAMKNRSEVLEAVRGKTHDDVNGALVPRASVREQAEWAGSTMGQVRLVSNYMGDPTKYSRLDSETRKKIDAWGATFTTGAASPELSVAAASRWNNGTTREDKLAARVAYLSQTNPAFVEGWKEGRSQNRSGADLMAYALQSAGIVDKAPQEPAPAASGLLRLALPAASDMRMPDQQAGKVFARAIENGAGIRDYFESDRVRFEFGGISGEEAQKMGQPGTALASRILYPLSAAKLAVGRFMGDVSVREKEAVAQEWATQLVMAANQAMGHGDGAEAVRYLRMLQETYDALPSELRPAFRVSGLAVSELEQLDTRLNDTALPTKYDELFNSLTPIIRSRKPYTPVIPGEVTPQDPLAAAATAVDGGLPSTPAP